MPWFELVMAVALVGILLAYLLLDEQPEQPPSAEKSKRCTCGYDLRATRDRCPECGRKVG